MNIEELMDMDKTAMRKKLRDDWGLDPKPDTDQDELREMLAKAEGMNLKVIDNKRSKKLSAKERQDKLWINVSQPPNENRPHFPVGVQGKYWLIKFGEAVNVPRSVVEVLRNARGDRFRQVQPLDSGGRPIPGTTPVMEKRTVLSYPFMVGKTENEVSPNNREF